MIQDNQQLSLEGVQFLQRTEKRNKKWYGLYKCPECEDIVELRIDTVQTHYKKLSYPKLCKVCANKKAGKSRVKHGKIETRLYKTWQNMKSRCYAPTSKSCYKGILVCDEWQTFPPFAKWALLNGYTDTLTLDRIDSYENYTPDNCRFITLSENSRLGALSPKRVKESSETISKESTLK